MANTKVIIASAIGFAAAMALPTQSAQASIGDNGDRASPDGPVCVWEDKQAADAKDMKRGTCFTPGYHEDAYHYFYNQMGERSIGHVTVSKGYYADLVFMPERATDAPENVRAVKSGPLQNPRMGLDKIYVHSLRTGRTHRENKACLFKEKGWYELDRTAHARCLPVGEYPDITLPQFDAKNWFKYLNLSDGYQAILYTGKNFTGTATRITRDGLIAGTRGQRVGRGGKSPAYLSVKIIRL